MEKIDVAQYDNEAQLLVDIVKKAQESNADLEKLSVKEILANVSVFRDYLREYFKLRKEGEIIVSTNPDETPCGKLEVEAFDDIQEKVRRRSFCREIWGDKVFSLFNYDQIDSLQSDKIKPIANLMEEQLQAVGPNVLCDERMTNGRINAIFQNLTSEKIKIIGPQNLFRDVLSFSRVKIFSHLTAERIEGVGVELLLKEKLDNSVLVSLGPNEMRDTFDLFHDYGEFFLEELKQSGFGDIADALGVDLLPHFNLEELLSANPSRERLDAISKLDDWQLEGLQGRILFGEEVSNEDIYKIASIKSEEEFDKSLSRILFKEDLAENIIEAMVESEFGHGLVVEFGIDAVKKLGETPKKISALRWLGNYDTINTLGIEAILDDRMTEGMLIMYGSYEYIRDAVKEKGVEYFMENYEEIKKGMKQASEKKKADEKREQEEEDKRKRDEDEMEQWSNYM